MDSDSYLMYGGSLRIMMYTGMEARRRLRPLRHVDSGWQGLEPSILAEIASIARQAFLTPF